MIFGVLGPLVQSRAFPDNFPQDTKWPAIRFSFVSAVPGVTICGSGMDPETDFTIQIDGVANNDTERDELRHVIQSAMSSFPLPATCDGWSKTYDAATKGYRIQLDYLIEPSSDASALV